VKADWSGNADAHGYPAAARPHWVGAGTSNVRPAVAAHPWIERQEHNATDSAMLVWLGQAVSHRRAEQCGRLSLPGMPTPHRFGLRCRSLLPRGASHGHWPHPRVRSPYRSWQPVLHTLLPHLRYIHALEFQQESWAGWHSRRYFRRLFVPGPSSLRVGAIEALLGEHSRRGTALSERARWMKPPAESPIAKRRPDPSIERTSPGKPGAASHVKR